MRTLLTLLLLQGFRVAAQPEIRCTEADWGRMPRWTVEGLLHTGPGNGDRMEPPLPEPADEHENGWRVGAAYRWNKGWQALIAFDRTGLRNGGVQDREVLSIEPTSPGWFPGSYYTYRADLITVGHDIHSLYLGAGLSSGPFPCGSRAGMRLNLRAGLRIQHVSASYGSETVTEETFVIDGDDLSWENHVPGFRALRQWSTRTEVATQNAMGLGLELGLRAELWLGRNLSLLVPDVSMTVPLVKPSFDAVEDPGQGVRIEAYALALQYSTVGAGLAVHW